MFIFDIYITTYSLVARYHSFRKRLKRGTMAIIIVKCLLFAKIKDLLNNQSSIDIELDDDHCKPIDLFNKLKQLYPQASSVLDICMLAINLEYVDKDENIEIKSTDEVSIIPPVSGG
ncbi:molybdenum cofactor synthesis protein 2 small subunit [Cavenderia fasciculata]|uniref:Molybdenum cofactor synthesis protein 2 small subunit n=1 Tax=Cavenderia fasciculata TaxID=261658 RepID=F4Q6B6_CACFS|nr:molybdenum cofactor synthesis protein 2 small subunit [Cavenderia fasciculata]EGG16426.1 molybdenum cofactor synthesis protein 2 small subunit [Cavenderia fasciculata]|eukprot:XP_004354826.1 molybdenum cofactor synthesis protein 2 small subunit [Cavenderia fasciculata]